MTIILVDAHIIQISAYSVFCLEHKTQPQHFKTFPFHWNNMKSIFQFRCIEGSFLLIPFIGLRYHPQLRDHVKKSLT